MKFLQPLLNLLNTCWRWVRFSPFAPAALWLVAIAVMLLCQRAGYHESFMPQQPANFKDLPKFWQPSPDGVYLMLYLLSYMRLFALVGGVVYHAYIIRAYPNPEKMLRPTWVVAIYLTLWSLASNFYDKWESTRVGVIGEEVSTPAFVIQMVLMVCLLFSPPFIVQYFIRCKILERYVLRTFLQPLIFCFIAFCTLWIVMDVLDHLSDFRQNNVRGLDIAQFYLKLIPFIYVTVAPVTLLLATLYSLGKMSRSNELISMLGVGRSLGQVLRPIFIVGIYASFLGMVADYHWAPNAAGNKEKMLDDVKEQLKQDVLVRGLVYRNHQQRRTWFIGIVPSDLNRDALRRIEIREEDDEGHLTKAWFANSAKWFTRDQTWSFFHGTEVTYENGRIVGMTPFAVSGNGRDRKDETGWTETPWILLSGSLTPEFLGVPQLLSYLSANRAYDDNKLAPFRTHLFYRFALPFQVLLVVIIAAPLGVVFSRRGLLGGVASSIFIFFVLLFIDHLFLNLGKGRHMPPFLAVWMPHLILGSLGFYIFRLRSQNRDLPSLNLKGIMRGATSLWTTLRMRLTKARA